MHLNLRFMRCDAVDRCAVHMLRGATPSYRNRDPVADELHRDGERRAPRGSREQQACATDVHRAAVTTAPPQLIASTNGGAR
jgi:hypothetical protein